MEGSDSIQKALMNELIQGRDVTKQLQLMFSKENLSSNGAQELMVQKILGCYENSIAILQSDLISQQSQRVVFGTTDSPPSFMSGSPKSQDFEGDFKDQGEFIKSKNVITMETRILPGCSSNRLEQPIEDGYNWRKYGQKEILASKYPRAYYRCTQSQMQGCKARKQVQRTDHDPTLFQVNYRGKHTCSQPHSFSANPNPNPNPHPNFTDIKLEPYETLTYNPQNQQNSHEIIWSFQTDNQKEKNIIKKPIKTNDDIYHKSTSLSFPSSSNPNSLSPMRGANNSRGHSEGQTIQAGDNNSLMATAPEYLFGQGEFDHEFMFEDPSPNAFIF